MRMMRQAQHRKKECIILSRSVLRSPRGASGGASIGTGQVQRFFVTTIEVHKQFWSINIPSKHIGSFGFIRQDNAEFLVV